MCGDRRRRAAARVRRRYRWTVRPLPRARWSAASRRSSTPSGSEDHHSVIEIARMTGLPVSTTHRLMSDMAAWQILQRTPEGDYRIGLALQMLQADATYLPTLHELAPHVLTDLCEGDPAAGPAGSPRERPGVLRRKAARRGPGVRVLSQRDPSRACHGPGQGPHRFRAAGRDDVVSRRMTAYTAQHPDLAGPSALGAELGTGARTWPTHAASSSTATWPSPPPSSPAAERPWRRWSCRSDDLHNDLKMCAATLTVAARGLSRALVGDASAGRPPTAAPAAGTTRFRRSRLRELTGPETLPPQPKGRSRGP